MKELLPYFNLLVQFPTGNSVALDHAHNLLIVGAVVARKPERVLELGVGSGFLTSSLMTALRFNGRGQLTSVDNWLDNHGREPQGVQSLRDGGVKIIAMGEREFVYTTLDNAYDFLVSDADHFNSATWLDQHLRIVAEGGFLFFHDTNQPGVFPTLATLEKQVKRRGLMHFHFKTNSRPDERCDRGLLFVVNKK